MNWGNQYMSRKGELRAILAWARSHLAVGHWCAARVYLDAYRRAYARVPASTHRRWRCGR